MSKTQKQALQAKKEHLDHQAEAKKEQALIQQAFNQNGELSEAWMQEILGVEDLEEHLQPHTVHKIQGLINKQLILSNLNAAEAHDRVYKLDVEKLKVLGEHPPEESVVQGPLRAVLNDDETEDLYALTAQERNIIDQVFFSLKNAVLRSREGFERQQINTSIARSENANDNKEDDADGLSLF